MQCNIVSTPGASTLSDFAIFHAQSYIYMIYSALGNTNLTEKKS